MTPHLLKEERWLKIIVWVFLGLGTIYMVGRALGISKIDAIYHPGFSANSMFWTWFIALAFSQVVFNTKLQAPVRALLAGIVLLTFFVAVTQAYNWKSGWIPALVAAGVILALKFPRLLILSVPAGLISAYFLVSGAIGAEDYSWGTRVDAWKIVLEISKVNPILGLGFSNYYWYTPLFAIRGWAVNFNSHSQYVDLIAQVGIVGLLGFLWIFLEMGKLSWKLHTELPDGFTRAYAYGVFAGLVGSLMAAFLVDWILPFVYNIGFYGFRASILIWIFFGGLLSIEQMYLGMSKTSLSER
jgi:O-antigen ligase